MQKSLQKILSGYRCFREKYACGDSSIMNSLSLYGQKPEVMVLSCCDSRVDPALILQCDPGDLFVVRNIANIVPPFEKDEAHHGTSAALEFGIRFLQVKHLILLGHSQCGGIKFLLDMDKSEENDFISKWMSLIKDSVCSSSDEDTCAQRALQKSYENCLTFPWIQKKLDAEELFIHLWFFDIKKGEILFYSDIEKTYIPLITH